MTTAFVDESERPGTHFLLAALIVSEAELAPMNQALDQLVREAINDVGIHPLPELHAYDLMNQKRDWRGAPMRLAVHIMQKALSITEQHAEALYVECIDIRALQEKYDHPWNPRTPAFSYLLERVNEHAERIGSSSIKVLFDDHYTAPEGRKEFVRFKREGTFGYRTSKLDKIKSIDFIDSKTSRALQAADLCCYISNRNLTVSPSSDKAKTLQKSLYRQIKPLIDRGRERIWPRIYHPPRRIRP